MNIFAPFQRFTFSLDVQEPGRGQGARCLPVVSHRPVSSGIIKISFAKIKIQKLT